MIRKIIRFLVGLGIILSVIFFFTAGKIADRLYNRVSEPENIEVSAHARSLHERLMICDLHNDVLLWDRDITASNNRGHSDIARLVKGNFALQVFDAVIKVPKDLNYESNNDQTDQIRVLAMANRWPIRTWFSQYERAIHQSNKLKDFANTSSELELITNKSELDFFMKIRKNNSYKVAGLLSIEGLHALEGRLENLDGLINAGYRIMGLVHFFDNDIGGSSAGEEKGGLTDFGKRVILKMEREQIIVDLAHASPALFDDVLELATRPVIVSHTGISGIYPSPRNLTDQQIRKIANNGGIIGIGFWEGALGAVDPQLIAQSIAYVRDLVGIEYVSLGSDFDGSTKVPFEASEIILLTESLIREGLTDEEIKLVMGENVIRFLKQNLPS
jgi:microsomal dipeptidase-like Zn-dependent dipeptidase